MDFTWILVIAFLFASLDAYGIGANDVANSFATSVGSRSLTLKQACICALIFEFTGALALGANTADTIRGKILDINVFKQEPYLLMFAMMSALIGSSLWINAATYWGLPVSTTHSIIGGIIGAGMASRVYIGGATCLISFFFIYKGAPGVTALATIKPEIAGAISAGVGVGCGLVSVFTFIPYVKWRMRQQDEQIAALEAQDKRVLGADEPTNGNAEKADYYAEVNGTTSNLPVYDKSNGDLPPFGTVFNNNNSEKNERERSEGDLHKVTNKSHQHHVINLANNPMDEITESSTRVDVDPITTMDSQVISEPMSPGSDGDLPKWKHYLKKAQKAAMHGVNQEVVHYKEHQVQKMHDAAAKYEEKTERLFSFVQIMTACTASFAHVSNDVANAVGPLTAIWFIHQTGTVTSKSSVPIWALACCAGMLCIGLVTYGYNIMRSLGNRLTCHSPSRGFSMELGAAVSVLTSSRMGWPISTTHCITGATMGVGLCARDLHAVNWTRVLLYLFAWVVTLPVAGLIAAGVFSFAAYAPKAYT